MRGPLTPALSRLRDAVRANPDFTSAELGAELGLAEKTVKNQVGLLLEAYHVTSRHGLIAELVWEEVRRRQTQRRCPCCGHELE
jgi:hypothetical protein